MLLNVTNDSGRKLSAGSDRDAWATRQGAYSAAEGLLTFRRKHRRIVFDADARTSFQYHPQISDTIGDYGARVAVQLPLRRRTQLSATHSSSYFQSYQLPTLAEEPTELGRFAQISESRHAVSRLAAYVSATSVHLEERLTPRSSIHVEYDAQSVQFAEDDADLRTWGARGRFSRRIARSVLVRVGYGQRVGRYGASHSSGAVRIHDLDLGIDYRRSLSRTLTVNVTPGSSIVVGSEGHEYRVTGDVLVKRRVGRTWNTTVLYRRSSEFIEGFTAPFFVDSATAGVAGHLGRRVDIAGSAGYSTGDLSSMSYAMYDSYSGSARVRYALDRHIAVSLEYLYYNHRFDGEIAIPAAAVVNRHSMRIGLLWWRPLR